METESIRINFFKDGSDHFFELLGQSELQWKKVQLFPPGTIIASGEAAEIIRAISDLAFFPSLAAIIVAWLKSKSSRKVIVTTKSKEVVIIQGQSPKEIEKVLAAAERFDLIQTEKDEVESNA